LGLAEKRIAKSRRSAYEGEIMSIFNKVSAIAEEHYLLNISGSDAEDPEWCKWCAEPHQLSPEEVEEFTCETCDRSQLSEYGKRRAKNGK